MVIAIAVLFTIRRFLLNRHDMVETPDGLVEVEEMQQETREICIDNKEKVLQGEYL